MFLHFGELFWIAHLIGAMFEQVFDVDELPPICLSLIHTNILYIASTCLWLSVLQYQGLLDSFFYISSSLYLSSMLYSSSYPLSSFFLSDLDTWL